jgi:hypothetical protein
MKIFYVFIFLSIYFFARAQEDSATNRKPTFWSNTALQVMYQYGHVFATNDFLRGNNVETEKINYYQAFALKFSKQTTGDKLWEQVYDYPYWGLGLYAADFYNPEEIGVPIAIYGFFDGPFIKWNKLSFNYELSFGAAFHWKSFDPLTNKYNVVIGAGESFLIDAELNFEYNLSNKIDISAGFSLTHFSNGTLKKPNFGINTIAPKITLKYNFYNHLVFHKQEIPKYIKENEWLISCFGGVKNVIFDSVNTDIIEKYEGVYFPVFGISTSYNRQISYKSKIGLGMTVSYDGSVNAQVTIDNNELDPADSPLLDKIQVSVYPSYELVINKVSLLLQPAVYLYRKKTKSQSPVFHQRIGLKYHVSDNIFIGLTLRDYSYHISDFIEWTLGYRIKWR